MERELEVLLFAAGDEGLSVQELSKYLEVDRKIVEEELAKLQKNLEKTSALWIYQKDQQIYLTTQSKYASLLEKYTNQTLNKKLSKASLEVLAIIAYRQPITRIEIDQIRGVNSSGAVQKLQAYRLIEALGRVEGPGRARLFGTTKTFLDYFKLNSLDELPKIEFNEEEQDVSTSLLFDQFDEILDEE